MTDQERHAWALGGWWHVAFSAIMAAMVALALLTGPEQWRWLTAVLLSSVVAVYFVFAKPLVSPEKDYPGRGQSLVLVALILLPTLPAVIINPTLVLSLVAIAPVCFMTVGSLLAVPTVGAILILPTLVSGIQGRESWDQVGVGLLINGAILGYALWFGTWIERLVVQSAERYVLIEALQRSREEVSRLSQEATSFVGIQAVARPLCRGDGFLDLPWPSSPRDGPATGASLWGEDVEAHAPLRGSACARLHQGAERARPGRSNQRRGRGGRRSSR
jgi:hypothetical protein